MTVKSTTVWNVEQSKYLMSILSAKSVIVVGQFMDWNRGSTLFITVLARMTTMKGITTMVVFSSDQSEILHFLKMCTPTALDKSKAKKIFKEAPYQLGNPEILITRKSENQVDDKVH